MPESHRIGSVFFFFFLSEFLVTSSITNSSSFKQERDELKTVGLLEDVPRGPQRQMLSNPETGNWKWNLCSCVPLFETPWTTYTVHGILQAEYWSEPFPSPGDFPNPGIKPRYPALQVDSLPAEPQGKPKNTGAGGLNTGVGGLSLLQWIFLTQESNWDLLHCRSRIPEAGAIQKISTGNQRAALQCVHSFRCTPGTPSPTLGSAAPSGNWCSSQCCHRLSQNGFSEVHFALSPDRSQAPSDWLSLDHVSEP